MVLFVQKSTAAAEKYIGSFCVERQTKLVIHGNSLIATMLGPGIGLQDRRINLSEPICISQLAVTFFLFRRALTKELEFLFNFYGITTKLSLLKAVTSSRSRTHWI